MAFRRNFSAVIDGEPFTKRQLSLLDYPILPFAVDSGCSGDEIKARTLKQGHDASITLLARPPLVALQSPVVAAQFLSRPILQ